MAEGPSGSNVTTFAIFVTVLLLFSTPAVSATNNGVTIIENSINLSDFQTIEDDYYELKFNLSAVDQGTSNIYVGQVIVETALMDGTVLTNSSYAYELAEGTDYEFLVNLTNLAFGYTVIIVDLVGDTGAESQNHLIGFERTLQRLNPMSISIGTESSIIIESLASDGTLSGNSSISDGDYVQLQIPVINNGDYDWSGSLNLTLDNGAVNESLVYESLTVIGMDTTVIYFNSSLTALEGSLQIYLALSGTQDNDNSDNFRNFSITVNPPPLPILNIALSYETDNLESGSSLVVTAVISNSGSVDFTGNISCLLVNDEVHNSILYVSSFSNATVQFTITVRPGELFCSVTGQRTSFVSINSATALFSVESALFEYAGGSTPVSTDGPWHVGDESTFSLLVRNTGTKQGNVGLIMESLGNNIQGESILLGPDEAGEVLITVPIMQTEIQNYNWSLFTTDGEISGDISGQVALPVAPRQSFDLTIYDVSWSVDNGVTAQWMVNLSAGIDRQMNIQIGYGSNSNDEIVYDVDMTLTSGSTGGQIALGKIDAQYVVIKAMEVNWSAESSFSTYSKSIPQDRPNYDMRFNAQSTPNRPVVGESASVSIVLENLGAAVGPSGSVILFDKDNIKLAEANTEKINPGSSQTITFNFIWPAGEDVKLNCKWDYDGESLQIDRNFLSTIVTIESKDDFNIPWTGILGGLAIASLVILTLKIRSGAGNSKEAREKPSKQASRKDKFVLSDVKIEIGCPVCSRQLRVPENYEGTVKCPDCSHSFEVGTQEDATSIQDEAVDDDQKDDGKVEISCPECSQSLRIPKSYDGSVRCPSCKAVFSAEDG